MKLIINKFGIVYLWLAIYAMDLLGKGGSIIY